MYKYMYYLTVRYAFLYTSQTSVEIPSYYHDRAWLTKVWRKEYVSEFLDRPSPFLII